MTEQEKQEWYRDTGWLHETFWRWQAYRKPCADWNHEHCVFCARAIAERGYSDPTALHEAWTTTFVYPDSDTGYEWVCPSCFEQLRATFFWGVVEAY